MHLKTILNRVQKQPGFVYRKAEFVQPKQGPEVLEIQREFTAVDSAVDWLKRNHKAVLIGSVVVIAGVAFVVVSAGAGLVVLAPAVLVTSGSPQIDPPLAVVSP